MPKWLAMVAYRCEINGRPDGSVDVRVLGFEFETIDAVQSAILLEPMCEYTNHIGEKVAWKRVQILSIEEFNFPQNGDELIGFITKAEEFEGWASD